MPNSDHAILRELLSESTLWTANLDPRTSDQVLAERSGVVRSTVWSRLRKWRKSGFIAGFPIIPNPGLFDHMIGQGWVRLDRATEKQSLVESLAHYEGLIGASDFVGPWLTLAVVGASTAAFQRWTHLFRRTPGVSEVIPFEPYRVPPCDRSLSHLDWRILIALARSDEPNLGRVARDLKVTVRTVARHYARLRETSAMWCLPVFDYSKEPGSVFGYFNVFVKKGGSSAAIVRGLRERYPEHIVLSDDTRFVEDVDSRQYLIYTIVPFSTVVAADDAQRAMLEIPGVRDVELLFPRRDFGYWHWFDEQMASALNRTAKHPGNRSDDPAPLTVRVGHV